MNILIEDLPENVHQMVNIIGLEKFIEISKIYGGTSVYFPMYKTLCVRDRNRKIVNEFNGKNSEFLRKKYNVSYAQVRSLVKDR